MCTSACASMCEALLAEGASILRITRRKELLAQREALLERERRARRPDVQAVDVDELHERNMRIHGGARADLARWSALMQLSVYLRACEQRRKERALQEALEALERAREAEEGEKRWLRIGAWLARRVDEGAARLAKRTKVVTRIDFSPQPDVAKYGESLEVSDLESNAEEDEIKW